MAVKTILFLAGFFLCSGGALLAPLFGVAGYVLYYTMGLGWWAAPVSHWGIRYSYTLALATGLGALIHWRKLRFGKPILSIQEKLVLLFLGIVWLSTVYGGATTGESYLVSDHPSLKLSKIVIFCLLLTHIVTSIRKLNVFFWVLIIGTLHLGIKAYQSPSHMFISGRLENVGGPDFRSANDLAVFLAVMIPVIGIMFLKTHWPGKILCAVSGVCALNAIVLTRSRTGLLGLVCGALVLAFFVPGRHRNKVIVGLIVAGIGFVALMDTRFINRSQTILQGTKVQDQSAQGRIDIWRGAVKMIMDKPLGVGAGNFYQNIGQYVPNAKNRDAHNTYIRCAAELGLHGFALLTILIVNSALMIKNIKHQIAALPGKFRTEPQLIIGSLAASFTVFIVAGLTGTMLYLESFWWWLLLPVCLQRCINNLRDEVTVAEEKQEHSSTKFSKAGRQSKKHKK